MKFKIWIAAFFFSGLLQAQDEETAKLPDFTPPPPEAAAITKYADLQASEFTGSPSYNLPLYTYTAGKLQIPINLQYSGLGVKVDDVTTWTGINWTLNAGGVITRSVRDLADEKAVHRVFLDLTDIDDFSYLHDGEPRSDELHAIIEGDQYDSEPDLFQFSFSGYSGSFYLDQDWIPRITKEESPIKIEVVGTLLYNKEFRITTPDGVVYYFGGSDAVSTTTRRYVADGSVQPRDTNEGITAFYLYRIVHPIYGQAFLEYDNVTGPEIVISQKIEKRRKWVSNYINSLYTPCTLLEIPGSTCTNPAYMCSNVPPKDDITSRLTVSTRTYDAKYLKRIYGMGSSGEVRFESHHVDNEHFKRVLDRILIFDNGNSTPYKTIDFEYLGEAITENPFAPYSDVSKRLFLDKVVFDKYNIDAVNTQDGRRNQVYEFEYNNPLAVPPRFSYAQDYLGYYNGKESNLSAIPDITSFNPWGASGFANRDPEFSLAICGTLKKIHYPAGGYTLFEYEGKKAKERMYKTINLEAFRNQPGNPSNQLFDGVPKMDGENNILQVSNLYEDQSVVFAVRLETTASATQVDHNRDKAKFIISDITNPLNPQHMETYPIALDVPQDDGSNRSREFTFSKTLQQGHSYSIKIRIYADSTNVNIHPMKAKVNFKYYDNFQEVDDSGILLKRMTDFSENNVPENIKRYYYRPITTLAPTIAELPLTHKATFAKTEDELYNFMCSLNPCCVNDLAGPPLTDYFVKYKWLLSDYADISSTPGLGIFEYVTISYGGDDFENGGIEKHFRYIPDYTAGLIPTVAPAGLTNHKFEFGDVPQLDAHFPQPRNGTILGEKVYRKTSDGLQKIQQTEYQYQDQTIHSSIHIVAKKLYHIFEFPQGVTMGETISNYYVMQYLQESLTSELVGKRSTQYIDPVPLSVTDESSYRKILSTEDYEYASFTGQPTKVLTNTSDEGEIEKRYYYIDMGADNALPGEAISSSQSYTLAAYEQLEQSYIVASPVQIEVWKNGSLLSRQRTLYSGTWPTADTDASLDTFPKLVLASKGNGGLETRVEFLDYDGAGNPTQLKQPGGNVVAYQYDPKGKVTLKVENYIGTANLGEAIVDFEGYTGGGTTPPATWNSMNNTYPGALVTRYHYDSHDRLTRIVDPKGQETTFGYNALGQLIWTKDDKGHITKTFDLNFDRY